MIYPKNFENKIGFDVIRNEIERHCISPMGAACTRQMQFSSQFDEVETRLMQVHEFVGILQSKREFPLNHFIDMRGALKIIAAPGTHLTAAQLFDLQRSLHTMGEIVAFLGARQEEHGPEWKRTTTVTVPYPNLAKLTSSMQAFPAIERECERVLDKFGNVKDNASPELRQLRATLASTTASINDIMRRPIGEGRQNGYFDGDTSPSVRDGRLVLPVSPQHKRKVKGIVHDESATGRTIFIEPAEIVEANNRIRETEGEIMREVIRILTEVTSTVRPHVDDLLASYEVMGAIDFVRAKAVFAIDVDAHLPHLHHEPGLEWYHAQHPGLMLSLRAQGKQVVPLNIELTKEKRLLVISGPNAGGKSVCLKTVGIVQYMMQCGVLPTLHDNSHMGIFNNLMIDIGDQQSIEDDLSTYSSHLQNMKTFMIRGDKRTLLLIDEMGSGTEPQIGAAIAQTILVELNKQRVFGVVTTHYQNLKHLAEDTPGLVNGAMLYDRQHMQPLFQLSIGYPGSSFAIEIARKIGLPKQVIDGASELVGSDYIDMDKYLLDIVRDRKYWERKRFEVHQKEKKLDGIISTYNERLEKIAAEHKLIIKEAKNEAQEILRNSNAEIERTIREIKTMQAEKEKTREVRQHLEDFKKQLQGGSNTKSKRLDELAEKAGKPRQAKSRQKQTAAQEPENRPLAVNDHVTLADSKTVGVILELEGKWATVAFGNLKTRIEVKKLTRTMRQLEKPATKPALSASASDAARARQLNFKQEIDVRGMRGDEALQHITYFIDDAIQFQAQRVRILHGTGTGILKTLIRQYLNTVSGVKNYHDEDVRLGGAGITVVNLM